MSNPVYFNTTTIEYKGARYFSIELTRETTGAVYTWNIIRTGLEFVELERVNYKIVESLPKTAGVKQLRAMIDKVKPLARELLRLAYFEYDSPQFRAKWWEIKNLTEQAQTI